MVFSAGNVLTAAALNDATLSGITTYTPTVANGGTVTWSTRTGWYYKIGTSHLVFMAAYLVASANGSGTTSVTITAPTSIDRTTRQVVPALMTSGANDRVGGLRANISGSGAIWDVIMLTNPAAVGASPLTGNNIANGDLITISGFYRET